MIFIYNQSTDPYYNLAAEEFLTHSLSEEVCMLWRNENTIVVGKNQNTLAEIHYEYVKEQGICVVRRMSGGGAVFHDLGNINYTFISNSGNDFSNYEKFTAPVIAFLKSLGIEASLRGRNDLVIGDKKISGNAQYMYKNRVLHHGTLLYSAEQNKLTEALKVSEDKIKSKGIASVKSRVTNIASYLQEVMPPELFMEKLADFMVKSFDDCRYYDITVHDAEIRRLRDEKYTSWEWNFGYSPKYEFSKKMRYPFGGVEIHLEMDHQSVIKNAKVYGDFFSQKPIAELEERLCGVFHEESAIRSALQEVLIAEYIQGMSLEEFLTLLF